MPKRIFLKIRNRLIYSTVLRFLVEAGFEAVDAFEAEDIALKLGIYQYDFMYFIIEVQEERPLESFQEIKALQADPRFANIPVLAILPKDTSDFVSSALQAGVRDVFLLPKQKEGYRDTLVKKLEGIFKPDIPEEPDQEPIFAGIETSETDIREIIDEHMKFAGRGQYPISMLMIHFTGVDQQPALKFVERLESILRETDRVYFLHDVTWLVICPFTEKKFVVEVEKKVFSTFESEVGRKGNQRIHLYAATYPMDETNTDLLLRRMEKGIRTSMAVDDLKTPLNNLSKVELEDFRKKLRQYRKFF